MQNKMIERFDLTGKIALITGCAGLLGVKHAEAILECGGSVILTDWHTDKLKERTSKLYEKYDQEKICLLKMDVTNCDDINFVLDYVYMNDGKIDCLINNASKNPKVSKNAGLTPDSRFEVMTEEYFRDGTEASIFGTFLVTQKVTNKMLTHDGPNKGVIINILSDLAVIAPDQRMYKKDGIPDELQNVKPITYSIAKYSQLAMVKYLATYFADKGIRVNGLSPSGVYTESIPDEFVKILCDKIPMGRMSNEDDYKAAIAFLASDKASGFMTGHNLVIDGGKTVW